MKKLTIEFPDEASREEFLGWFMDGGGDSDFMQSCEMHDIAPLGNKFKAPDKLKMYYYDEE